MNEGQSQTANQWHESDSATFLKKSELFVPARAEQIAMILGLLAGLKNEAGTIVELAAGGGLAAERILEQFPSCQYLALDGSLLMRERLATRLARFRDRLVPSLANPTPVVIDW